MSKRLSRLSASKIKTFQSCPNKYRYEYVEKIRGPRHPAAAMGTAVHTAVENVYKAWRRKLTSKDPVSMFQEEFRLELDKDKADVDTSYLNRLLSDGIKMVGDYDYTRIPKRTERMFNLKFPNEQEPICRIVGFIDHVYSWGFVDLKTNSRKPSQDTLDNDLQFILYHWAFEQLYHRKPEKSIWHHMRTHEDIEAHVEDKLGVAVSAITTLLAAKSENNYPKNIGLTCRWCSHIKDCLGVDNWRDI